MKTVSSGIQMKWMAVLATVFCLAWAAGASAEQGAKPCADDAARLCKDAKPGQGNMARCLKEHAGELSPACQENIAKMKENIRDFREACKDDMKKLCAGTQRGGGRIIQCMKQHEDELSPACKEQMDQHRGSQQKQ